MLEPSPPAQDGEEGLADDAPIARTELVVGLQVRSEGIVGRMSLQQRQLENGRNCAGAHTGVWCTALGWYVCVGVHSGNGDFSCLDGVVEEHSDGHGANTARNGGDEGGFLLDGIELDVADQFVAFGLLRC